MFQGTRGTVVAAALLVIAGLVALRWFAEPEVPFPGSDTAMMVLLDNPAIDFKADAAVNGEAVTLADLRGKVVLLDFWAIWCGPCKMVMPHLMKLHTTYKDQGLEVIGLTTYDERTEMIDFDPVKGGFVEAKEPLSQEAQQRVVRDFAAKVGLKYRLLVLPTNEMIRIQKAYQTQGQLPSTILIDRQGKVRFGRIGFSELLPRELSRGVKKLVEEK